MFQHSFFPKLSLFTNRLIFPLLSIMRLLSPVKIVAYKWINYNDWFSVVAKYWGKLLDSCRGEGIPVHRGAAQQGEAVALSVLWHFPRSPGFLCFTFLYSQSVRMKNMFRWEEEEWTFWHWNRMPFAAKSLGSECRDWNKYLHNCQIKSEPIPATFSRCRNTLFMVMSVFIF